MTAGTIDQGRAERLARLRAALPGHVERLGWDGATLARWQRDRLRELLATAVRRSPWHARRLAGIDPARFEPADLPGLPVMTKAELMAAFDEIVTDRRLTRARVEGHLAATGPDAAELPGGHVALASGGSSGERGVFVYDRLAAVDYTLGLTRAGLARLMAAGPLPPGGIPMATVAAGSAVHASRALVSLFGGDPLAVTSVPVTLPLPRIVERLNQLRPVLLTGYPSVLSLLAGERAAGRLRIAPRAITAHSEQLTVEARAAVEDAFGVPVADQFGSSEGLVGVSAPGDRVIVLAGDLAIAELVDERDRPVPAGTPSARVLVTSLISRAQPLIRYALDDRFVAEPPDPRHGHPRVTVEGRAADLLRFPVPGRGEVVVHPLVVRAVMVTAPEVLEYQVRQTASGLDVRVLAPGGTDEAALTGRLATALTGAGLPAPRVRVRRVAAIDRHPRTGKAVRFVPLPRG